MAKLEHLDERYLSKFFLGGAKKAKELEMSDVRTPSLCHVYTVSRSSSVDTIVTRHWRIVRVVMDCMMHAAAYINVYRESAAFRLVRVALLSVQMASQGDDDEMPHHSGGPHVSFAISAAAGAEAALQQRDAAMASTAAAAEAASAAAARATNPHAGDRPQQHGTGPATAGGPHTSSHQQPQRSALRHPGQQQLQQQQGQQQPRHRTAAPTVRLAGYTSTRSGVHQVDTNWTCAVRVQSAFNACR